MNFATLTNIATALFCAAVLVQSVRMMRSLKVVKDGALTEMVDALDKSTAQARAVLSEMKAILGGEYIANAKLVEEARTMRDELGVMIGIADASAERIVDAASAANGRHSADSNKDRMVHAVQEPAF